MCVFHMFEIMVRLPCFILISGLVFQCVRTEGSVGCLFSSSLCMDEEECFDDNAFGRCRTDYDNYLDYRHQIGPETLGLLEREFTRLFAGGYRWRHEYTQCVVQNILFSNRHSITYDPGLCARLMHLTLPDVPPEILAELESPDPDELAYIKFQPNQDDPNGYIFAEEIFNPANIDTKEPEVKETEKRSANAVDNFEDEWGENAYDDAHKTDDDSENTADKEAIFRKLLEIADDTGKLFEQFQTSNSDRYPDEDTPIIRTDLSSDLNQRPAYTEGGTQWIPVDEDSDFMMGNDIIDTQEKKRIRDENEIIHNNDIPLYGKVKYDDDSYRKEIDSYHPSPKEIEENDMEEVINNPSYENVPLDDEDKNFRWNYKHINKGIDNDLTRFARGNKNEIHRVPEPPINNNIKDVIEDDYLEDQLYAILPIDNGMSTFTRDMRYDTKKPGSTYMLHEDEDGDTTNDDIDVKIPLNMADEGAQNLISRISKSAREHQLQHLTNTPVVAQKSSTFVVPSREVIEGVQRVVLAGGSDGIPDDVEINHSDQRSKGKTFERLHSDHPDQPELIEGINDLSSKDMKDEDRMANAAKTGEGHIGSYDSVDATQAYLLIKEKDKTEDDAKNLVDSIGNMLNLPKGSFSNVRIKDREVLFKVNPNMQNLNASDVAAKAEENYSRIKEMTGITIEAAGIGDKVKYEVINPNKDRRLFILAFALCGGVAGILLAVAAAYLVRRHSRFREKLQNVNQPDTEPSQDYQDLCRQRMASKSNDKPENIHSAVHSPKRIRSLSQEGQASSSSHSSTSSWNEEPVTSNMDITTGHIILAYMEDHLKNKDRLDREWEGLCAYEAELCSTSASTLPVNVKKNRYTDVLPYDHSRVLLTEVCNVANCDYINASSITDHDPRNPAYIATQGPLPQTAADFWQMIWEQGSVVIVMLSRLMENGVAMCHRYWPEEGSEVYHIYEVHLVSEHIWCDDYLVRSFYLKNLRTNETRTVTQFHFMSWPDNGVPNSTKALLEFRRKVNKSYRGRSCPIVVHCSDGIGRTGTYCLIDMVLNRMAKGAKEIDIAATLEHVRDQRAGMVKTKAQFEFVLMAIAEEVHAILKALSQ